MNDDQTSMERVDDLAFWLALLWESVVLVGIGAVSFIGVSILLAVFA